MTTDAETPRREPRTIEIDPIKFEVLARDFGWMTSGKYDYERIAYELALSEKQTHRVLTAQARPSTTFIGGLITATHDLVGFRRVFRVVNLNDPIGKV
jgi:hypothetical protein